MASTLLVAARKAAHATCAWDRSVRDALNATIAWINSVSDVNSITGDDKEIGSLLDYLQLLRLRSADQWPGVAECVIANIYALQGRQLLYARWTELAREIIQAAPIPSAEWRHIANTSFTRSFDDWLPSIQ